ncbi:MAG TPA: UDP-N-acetylmuramoyl-tripeptide--D-alanyl-D-alanine ligase [Ignavibacteria bacterium]|nr:UDP-N-acetylmuramoyl-tripeptide--D-alanyl-D-alanine ligase [Ignavibacteria bacterium]
MNLKLDDISKIRGVKIYNAEVFENRKFTGVSIDSRKCSASDLFFAIKGERFDGHDFVNIVKAKCSVVTEKWFQKNKPASKRSFKNKCFITVKDTEKSLGELAQIYRSKFVIPVIAVSGSNGKTSTKDFIAEVLEAKYRVLKTEGNLNNQLGVPLTLFRLRADHEVAVIEIGTNHFGEVEKLCQIAEPQFGIITNIGKEHLEFLINIKGAARAEGELVEYLKKVYGTFFLNADDTYLEKYRKYKNIKTFSFGFKGRAEVKAKVKGFNKFYPELEINFNSKKIKAQLKNIGYQSCNAALCAAAVGFYFEVPVQDIKKRISGYKIESNRRNQLKSINGVWVIDDTYNSNPDSVKAALENLKAYIITGKKYIVLADMLELGKASKREHSAVGKMIRQMKFENLLTYGRDSFNTHKAARGVKNNFYFEDKQSMSSFLNLQLKKGDVVLVKGSRSMKMENIINNISAN